MQVVDLGDNYGITFEADQMVQSGSSSTSGNSRTSAAFQNCCH
jgi:hypothetical protein